MKNVYISESLDGKNFSHHYDLVPSDEFSKEDILSLVRSDDSGWSKDARGEEALRISDNGNGYEVSFEGGEKEFHIEYHEAIELFILLMQKIDSQIKIKESKITLQWPL